MEKRPEDRYQTVAELVDDFTIAAGMEPTAVSSSASHPKVEVPPPAPLDEVKDDEETVVRRRVTRAMTPPTPPPDEPRFVVPLEDQAPAAVSGFNPWKVLIPSMIGLLVIFGVIYAFSRNPQPTDAAPSSSPLAADPNSSPVEPAQPPTGQTEAGIPSGGSTNQNANVSAPPAASETPIDIGTDPGDNGNTNQNSNRVKPTPSQLPSPIRSVDVEPPPPLPTATKSPVPRATLPPAATASPPEQP
jgi:hypothetical protein